MKTVSFRMLLALLTLLAPLKSVWSCGYDLQPMIDHCNGLGMPIAISNCYLPTQNASNPYHAVCVTGLGHYYDCFGFVGMHVSYYNSCPAGETPPARRNLTSNQSCLMSGSVINPDTLTYTESISLVGVPYKLVYSNDKVPGRRDLYKINVPLTHPTSPIPSSVVNKKLIVQIVGREIVSNHVPVTGLNFNFEWDGKDQSGNTVTGAHTANISVREEYECMASFPHLDYGEYYILQNLGSGCLVSPPELFKTDVVLGSIYHQYSLIGGWNFDVRHHYDPLRKILHLGDGTNFNTEEIIKPNGDRWIVSSDLSEVYVFDSNYNHVGTIDGTTGVLKLSFSYNTNGQLVSIQDKYSNLTTIQYSGSSPTSITSPYGEVTSLSLNPNGYIETVTSPASEQHEMSYSSGGLLLSFEKPDGTTSTVSYNSDGSLLSDSSSVGNSVTLSKSFTSNGYNISATSALNRTRSNNISFSGSTYNSTLVFPDQMTRTLSENLSTRNTAINDGRKMESIAYTPDSRFNKPRVSNRSINDLGWGYSLDYGESVTLATPGDPFSLTSKTNTITFNSKTWTSSYTSSNKTYVEQSPLARTTTTVLNSLGDISSVQYASFNPISIAYDTRGRIQQISQSTNRKTDFTYNENGYLDEIKNALDQVTSFDYNSAGRVISQTLPDSRVINYNYDNNGNLSIVTPPGKPAHSMEYNGNGLMVSYLAPYLSSPFPATTFFYDNDKNLIEIARPDGQSVDFVYDSLRGDLNSIQMPNGNRTFSYTGGRVNQSLSEDGISKSIMYQGSEIFYETAVNGSISNIIYYNFDSNAHLSRERVVAGITDIPVDFTYDNDGLITQVGNQNLTRSLSTGFVSQTDLGYLSQFFTYSSSFGELSGIEAVYNGNNVYEETMTRDNLGRIVTRTEQYGTGTLKNYVYTYDPAGRLTNVTIDNAPHAQYLYDTNSNRITQTIDGTTLAGTYDPIGFNVGNVHTCAITPGGVKCWGTRPWDI